MILGSATGQMNQILFDSDNDRIYVCSLLVCVVNGDYSDWGPYGKCSKTCGGGMQTRKRTCTNPPPANGGDDCNGLGPDSSTRECNNQECPGIFLYVI